MSYGIALTLDLPFDDVVAEVRGALADQGFGIVTEIDMQATLRTKLGVEIPRQLIFGACNPTYAHRSLQEDPSIGLLLPCNVVVRSTGEGTVVEMINPQMLVEVTHSPGMQQIATEVSGRLEAAMDALRAPA
jgi:uncharacterized protein (DUF302 family)